jgi:hypothetical protein
MPADPHAGEQPFVGDPKNSAPAPQALAGTAGAVAGDTFNYRLSLNGVNIGWLGRAGAQGMWACVVPNQADAVPLQWYAYSGVTYLRIPGFGYMTWSGGLSGQPIAFNTWAYANGWMESGGELIATDSKQPLSEYSTDSIWLYANGTYSALGVTRV